MLDPIYGLQAADLGNPSAAIGALVMLAGALTAAVAGWLEYKLGRSNFVTRALDRWSR